MKERSVRAGASWTRELERVAAFESPSQRQVMTMPSFTPMRAGLPLLAVLLAFSPLQLPGSRSVAAGAECTTCCAQGGPKCVVCGGSCVVVDNAYDAGPGQCVIADT